MHSFVVAAHCIQIANEVRKLHMERQTDFFGSWYRFNCVFARNLSKPKTKVNTFVLFFFLLKEPLLNLIKLVLSLTLPLYIWKKNLNSQSKFVEESCCSYHNSQTLNINLQVYLLSFSKLKVTFIFYRVSVCAFQMSAFLNVNRKVHNYTKAETLTLTSSEKSTLHDHQNCFWMVKLVFVSELVLVVSVVDDVLVRNRFLNRDLCWSISRFQRKDENQETAWLVLSYPEPCLLLLGSWPSNLFPSTAKPG